MPSFALSSEHRRLLGLKPRRNERSFVAIDGEGKNTPNGGHIYTYLANSRGMSVRNPKGLSTRECFEFLLECRQFGIVVGFSINYDINMMLGDLPRSALETLWEEGKCRYKSYTIHWRPSKMFQVTSYANDLKRSVVVWDMFGFFGKSFVKSLSEWKICDEQTAERIQAMKDQRGDFANVSDLEIERYCNEECRLLEQLAVKLDSTFTAVGISLARYDGAGAAASSMLRKYGIKQHLIHFDTKLERLFLHAYFGGRNEMFQVGNCGAGFAHDINSAYPAAIRDLPSLRNVHFRYSQSYKRQPTYGIWRCSWNLRSSAEFAPFPFRLPDNSILYVRNGTGWYHAREIASALDVFGSQIQVHEGYYLDGITEYPFGFVDEVYKERAARKAAGDMAHLPLKLGLNSLYGKMAQGYGWKPNEPPPYQSYFWAGAITAHCRAEILRAVAQAPESCFAIATDGIFSRQQLQLPFSKELGEWECNPFDNYFSAQGGVYQSSSPEGIIQRNRGFATKDIDFDLLIERWNQQKVGATVTYKTTRFVGLGRALQTNFDDWRTWREEARKLSITTGNKWEGENNRLYLAGLPPGSTSQPYQPKSSWLDFRDSESVAVERDQP